MLVSTILKTILLVPCAVGVAGDQARWPDKHLHSIRNENVVERDRIYGDMIRSNDNRQKRAWSPFQAAWRSIVKNTIFASKTRETYVFRYKTYVKVGTYHDAFADFRSLVPTIKPGPDEGYYGVVGNKIKISLYGEDPVVGDTNARLVLREWSDTKTEITVDYIDNAVVNDVVSILKTLDN